MFRESMPLFYGIKCKKSRAGKTAQWVKAFTCHQDRRPQFDSQDPHGRKKETILCPPHPTTYKIKLNEWIKYDWKFKTPPKVSCLGFPDLKCKECLQLMNGLGKCWAESKGFAARGPAGSLCPVVGSKALRERDLCSLFSRQAPHLHRPIGFCSQNPDHPFGTGWDGFRKTQSGCHYWSPRFHVISVPTLRKAWFSWNCHVSFWFLVSEFLHLTNQLLWFVSKLGLYSWVRPSFLLTSQETEYETSDHCKIFFPCFVPYFWEDHSSSS